MLVLSNFWGESVINILCILIMCRGIIVIKVLKKE